MIQELPRNLNYNDVKPIGFPSHVRQEKYTPISFNTSTGGVSSSDVVRFNISTNGFWDPYSAYIKIEVDVSGMDGIKANNGTGAGALQVDNSAQSFINQLILYKGGTEIERIEEYDTIAAILNDMNCSNDNRQASSFEGMNCNTSVNNQNYSSLVQGTQIGATYTANQIMLGFGANNNTNSLGNPVLTYGNSIYQNVQTSQVNRFEYFLLSLDSKNALTVQNVLQPFGNGQTYSTAGTGLQYGYTQPFNAALSNFGNEAILSNNLQSFTQYKGICANIYANKQTFCIPLISGLLGILMPKESYKYIPMKALQELIIEFRLNPYAMFTSGYSENYSNNAIAGANATVALNTTTNPMLSRIWKITKFEINVEVQYFEPQIENIILSQLNTEKGIIIHSNSWMLGPRYQIAAGTSPTGTYQVNLGFESLKNVIWCYIPDEFTTYTFCRKQYRLSANLNSVYVKVGSEYYPPLPVTGHGGTCAGYTTLNNDNDMNNSEFLIQLYKSFGKFNDIQQNCIINPQNFAVNFRAYNPTNVNSHSTGQQQNNFDTSLGQPIFHENRCVGRAVYAMNLETLNQDYSVISGINTINNRPFEITVKSDNQNGAAYPRAYTMYVFCQYDMLIQLRSTGIQILGRG